jgi:transcription antitermination factor NusG
MENTIKKIHLVIADLEIEIKETHIKTSPDKNLSFCYFLFDKTRESEFLDTIQFHRSKIGFNRVFSVKPDILKKQKEKEKKEAIRDNQILPGDKVLVLEGELAKVFAEVDSIDENKVVVKLLTFSNVFYYETLEMHQVRKLSRKELEDLRN